MVIPKVPSNKPRNISALLSTGFGCLSGLITTLVISLIGLAVFGLLSGTSPATGRTISIVFLFITIGFVIGALVFLRITAPGISIQGFGPIPGISINSRRTGKGFQNSRIIRLYLGLITCITVYLVYITFFALISDFSIGLSLFIFLIGLVFGPALAVLVAIRASIS
jgi:hypothetical protein